MPRTDNDTWDLATSVGATATMVAAARAVATKADNPLIDDRFAEPLVRAVGVDFLTKLATGELDGADVDDEEAPWKLEHMPIAMGMCSSFQGASSSSTSAPSSSPVGLARRYDAVRGRPARGDR